MTWLVPLGTLVILSNLPGKANRQLSIVVALCNVANFSESVQSNAVSQNAYPALALQVFFALSVLTKAVEWLIATVTDHLSTGSQMYG